MTEFDVRNHGAVGDGETLDTDAINGTIEACHEAGGGIVRVPEGTYRTGSIRLRSGVRLQLEAGATIRGVSNDLGLYDDPAENPYEAYQDFGHSHWHNSLVWAEGATDVAVIGEGTIDGSGMTVSNEVPEGGGDTALAFRECRDVTVWGVTVEEGGHFAVLATGCDDLLVRDVHVDTSRDGINFVACRDAEVLDSRVDCLRREDGEPAGGDDAIAFKSDYSLGYERESERLRVENCTVATGCNGIQFGSETVGDFRDVRVRDIEIEHAGKAGIGITTNDGAVIEDVRISDVTMREAACPIFLQVADRGRAPGDRPVGRIRDVTIEGVRATDCRGPIWEGVFTSAISGHPEGPISDVTLRDVEIEYPGGGDASDAGRRPPVDPGGYQPRKLGARPAAGLFCRHVRDLTLSDVRFAFELPDDRPTLTVAEADGVVVDRLDARRKADVDDARLRNVAGLAFERPSTDE